jgi:hypothetical protein
VAGNGSKRRLQQVCAASSGPGGFGDQRAVEYIERELADLVDIYLEQANVFSALVGILGTKALDSVSNFEKHRHSYTAQQRFPDLCRRNSRKPLAAIDCLESKGSKRAYAIQSHYNHAGWYVVWRYLVDTTESIEKDHPVIIWRVDMIFLEKDYWKYEASKASDAGGGRTHTLGVKKAAKRLAGTAVYERSGIVLVGGKPVLRSEETKDSA